MMAWTLALRTVMFLFVCESVLASSLKILDTNGPGTNTATVSGSITLSTEAKDDERIDEISSWALDFSAAQTDSSSNGSLEVTKSYETGIVYSDENLFDITLGGTFEKSELGQVQDVGPKIVFSRAWKYGHLFVREEPKKIPPDRVKPKEKNESSDGEETDEVESNEDFKSSVGFSFSGKKKDYSQKAPKANQQNLTISQTFLESALNWDPSSWLGVSFLYGKYTYDKDVAGFYALLNLPFITTTRGADLVNGFSSSLQGFADFDYGATLTFRLSETSSVDVGFTKSQMLVDRLWDTTIDVSFNSGIGDSIGYSIGGSSSMPSDDSGVSSSGNVSLSYFF